MTSAADPISSALTTESVVQLVLISPFDFHVIGVTIFSLRFQIANYDIKVTSVL